MNFRSLIFVPIVLLAAVLTAGALERTASDPFLIPSQEPETVISADSLELKANTVILRGKVRAVRGNDVLTCEKALLRHKPQWLLATMTPKLFRKESVSEKMVLRETQLEAENILWEEAADRINASPSVTVKIEERSWDLATYTWAVISADEMEGFRDQQVLNFIGNVKLRDKTRYAEGRKLEYFKASSTAVLSGQARLESEEFDPKSKKMVKRLINGERVIYNMQTKEAFTE